jgi:hypothetical protein
MPQNQTYDLPNNLLHETSIPVGAIYDESADVTGGWVDVQDIEGPVQAFVGVGEAVGAPESFEVKFELQEADTSGGAGAQTMVTQREVVLTEDKQTGILHGLNNKRYVRVVVVDEDSEINEDSSETEDVDIPVFAAVVGQLKYARQL